jgi:hypothetical protein
VVRHTFKTTRPLEAEQTSGVAGEGNETIYGFCGFLPIDHLSWSADVLAGRYVTLERCGGTL